MCFCALVIMFYSDEASFGDVLCRTLCSMLTNMIVWRPSKMRDGCIDVDVVNVCVLQGWWMS